MGIPAEQLREMLAVTQRALADTLAREMWHPIPGKLYPALVPPTRWQRWVGRWYRLREFVARPFQWLIDVLRGYELREDE